ncbi:MAG: hypothetical protein AAGF60_08080 [Pseudomonadota bacterium]
MLAAPAAAQMTIDNAPVREMLERACVFATECVEAEGCTETEFEPRLAGRMGGMTPDEMIVEAGFESPAETVRLLGVLSNGALSLAGGTFQARHLLTVSDTGAARYTVHYAEGPMAISYLGTCE